MSTRHDAQTKKSSLIVGRKIIKIIKIYNGYLEKIMVNIKAKRNNSHGIIILQLHIVNTKFLSKFAT